jgi:hypothetical protein
MLACFAISVMGDMTGTADAATASTLETIEHLLNYVESSNCNFVRNRRTHDAKEAAAHLRKKYEAVKKKIQTPEQFVNYVAAHSSATGQPYRVQCKGARPQESRDWLAQELARYRKKSG